MPRFQVSAGQKHLGKTLCQVYQEAHPLGLGEEVVYGKETLSQGHPSGRSPLRAEVG